MLVVQGVHVGKHLCWGSSAGKGPEGRRAFEPTSAVRFFFCLSCNTEPRNADRTVESGSDAQWPISSGTSHITRRPRRWVYMI